MRLTALERRLTSRAFVLALEPVFDAQSASRDLLDLAAGNRRAVERVLERVKAVADPRGQVTARIVAALHAALEALEPSGYGPVPSHSSAASTSAPQPV